MTSEDRPPTRDDLELDEGELRETSDRLLQMLPAIRALEERKRGMHVGTDEFVAMSDQVESLARRLSAWALLEQSIARDAAAAHHRGEIADETIERMESRPVQRILADWREATIRYDQAEAGTPGQAEAAADMARFRREYHRFAEQVRARG